MLCLRCGALGRTGRHEHRRDGFGEIVRRPARRGRGQLAGGAGRGRRPAGTQRRRQDDDVLHDRGAGALRRRPHRAGRARHQPFAHVQAGPAGHRLPGPGGVGFSQADGGAKPGGHSGSDGRARRAAPRARGGTAAGVSHRRRAQELRLSAFGGRAAAHGDRPGAGGGPCLFAAGRALRRRRPHRCRGLAGDHRAPEGQRPGPSHHRPQRAGDAGDYGPGVHHARGPHSRGRRLERDRGKPRGPQVLSGRAVSAVTLLDRYILRELAGPLLFGVLAFTGLFFSVDLVQIVRMAAEYGAPGAVIVKLIWLRLPEIVVYTFPMAVLLAALLTLSRLSANSEIVAMQAGAVSFYRIVAPVIAAGLLVSGASLAVEEWIVPAANYDYRRVVTEDVQGGQLPTVSRNVILKEYQGGLLKGFLYASRYDGAARVMSDVTIVELERGRPQRTTYAARVVWEGNTWIMEDGVIHDYGGDSG